MCMNGVKIMAFSKGKRIEDETSKRIIDLAVNIGCKEGPDALTVTRICRELNCDRRVIYNRFRDIDEINLIVACRCNEELINNANTAINAEASYNDNFVSFVKAAFNYIYEKNSFFQYYTALYKITEDGISNNILQKLVELIDSGKSAGDISDETDSLEAAENIWFLITGISKMLASNMGYKYQDGLRTMLYGVRAMLEYMKKTSVCN